MNWFTSDQHYNHDNIIDYCGRPFANSKIMNDVMISKHNSRVAKTDTVYHLGDFKFGAKGPTVNMLIERLNGIHVFIKGNHDKNNGTKTILKYGIVRTFDKTILLAHKPEDAEMLYANGGIDICFVGHIHEKWKFRDHMINVGVDVWDFYPVDAKQIFKAYIKWKREQDEKQNQE